VSNTRPECPLLPPPFFKIIFVLPAGGRMPEYKLFVSSRDVV